MINTPSSLGTLICRVEGSIGCRDVRCSYLMDRVKECIIAYGKVLRTLAGAKLGTIPPCVEELIRMVGPYIPVTESEIIRPWPIEGFQLVDCLTAGRGAKASAEKQVPPEVSEKPEEGRKPGKDDDSVAKKELEEPSDNDSIVEISQEAEEPEVIIVDDDEGAAAALGKPKGAPLDSRGDHNYSHPFAAQSKPGDCNPGDAMLELIHINLDEQEKEETDNPPREL